MKPILKRGQYVRAQSTLYSVAHQKVASAGDVGLVIRLEGQFWEGSCIGMKALVYFEQTQTATCTAWVNERALIPLSSSAARARREPQG